VCMTFAVMQQVAFYDCFDANAGMDARGIRVSIAQQSEQTATRHTKPEVIGFVIGITHIHHTPATTIAAKQALYALTTRQCLFV